MKTCTKCEIEKELDQFSKGKGTKDGLQYWCKECIKEYRHDNKERLMERQKEYNKKNKERIVDHKKEYYKNNKDERDAYSKRYRKNNKNKIRARNKRGGGLAVCQQNLKYFLTKYQ